MVAWKLPLLAVLAAVSTACDASVAPIDVAVGCPQRPIRELERWSVADDSALIDDFENVDRFLPQLEGRNGLWIRGDDSSFMTLRAEASTACAGRGGGAGHFLGLGFSDWGANWTAVLRDNNGGAAIAYDASAYRGVSFWAATGSDVSQPLEVALGVTTLDVAWNGGVCSTCMDYYRTVRTLTASWQRFFVPFAELSQLGNGVPLVALDRSRLVGFIIWPERDFDLWIDDLRFER